MANTPNEPCKNCAKLRDRIAELEDELSAREESTARLESRAITAERTARKVKSEAEDAEYFREDQSKALQRAQERGDGREVERIAEKLKRGW